jgi:hypothetical protein
MSQLLSIEVIAIPIGFLAVANIPLRAYVSGGKSLFQGLCLKLPLLELALGLRNL